MTGVVAGLLLASAASASVVLHQDFEAIDPGQPGFQTAYDHRDVTTNNLRDRVHSMYDEATWSIGDNPFHAHSHWKDMALDGDALLVNGKVSSFGDEPSLAWAQSVDLVAGHYTFSFEVLDMCCISTRYANATSHLTFDYAVGEAMGRPIGDFTTLGTLETTMTPSADGFYRVRGAFDLAEGFLEIPTTVSFGLHDWYGARNGDDFAVDNIVVSLVQPFALAAAVPEPGVWLMLLLGFGGAGAALRRHRRLLSAVA
jgi:hypothetical protein